MKSAKPRRSSNYVCTPCNWFEVLYQYYTWTKCYIKQINHSKCHINKPLNSKRLFLFIQTLSCNLNYVFKIKFNSKQLNGLLRNILSCICAIHWTILTADFYRIPVNKLWHNDWLPRKLETSDTNLSSILTIDGLQFSIARKSVTIQDHVNPLRISCLLFWGLNFNATTNNN